MSKVREERTKLTAGWLNTIAAGSIVAGVIAPSVSLTLVQSAPPARLVLFSIIWLFFGLSLHFIARTILKGLEP